MPDACSNLLCVAYTIVPARFRERSTGPATIMDTGSVLLSVHHIILLYIYIYGPCHSSGQWLDSLSHIKRFTHYNTTEPCCIIRTYRLYRLTLGLYSVSVRLFETRKTDQVLYCYRIEHNWVCLLVVAAQWPRIYIMYIYFFYRLYIMLILLLSIIYIYTTVLGCLNSK